MGGRDASLGKGTDKVGSGAPGRGTCEMRKKGGPGTLERDPVCKALPECLRRASLESVGVIVVSLTPHL